MNQDQLDKVQKLLNEVAELRVELFGNVESYPTPEFNLLLAAQTQLAVIIDLSERE